MNIAPGQISEEELKNYDNWVDFWLVEHFGNEDKFTNWIDVANEATRLIGAEEGSIFHELIKCVAASCVHLELSEDDK